MRRAAEFFLLSAPFVGAGAFGVVEPWSRWLMLAWATPPCLILRPGGVACVAFLAPAAVALVQHRFPFTPDGPALAFGSAAPDASLQTAAVWLSAALLGGSASRLAAEDAAFSRRLAWAIAWAALAVAAVGLAQMADGNSVIYWLRTVKSAVYPFAGFYNRNHAATFIGVAAILYAGLLIETRPVGSALDNAAKRVTLAIPLLALIGAILATESRAALAALAVALAVLVRVRPVVLAGGAAAAGLWALYRSTFPLRLQIYESAMDGAMDRWLGGWGAGSFEVVAPVYMRRSLGGAVPHAHSDWLQLVFEFGFPLGLALLGAAFVGAAWRLPTSTGMTRAYATALLFVVIHAAVEAPLFTGVNLAVAGLCAGVLFTARRSEGWLRYALLVSLIYVSVAAAAPAADSLQRLGSAAYYPKDTIDDDLAGQSGGRELLARHAEPADRVLDARRILLRARALGQLGRPADAGREMSRWRSLTGVDP